MGKLTKAQRDTLVKNIQGKKIEGIIAGITCIISFPLCFWIWMQGGYSAHTKLFWAMLITGIFAFGIVLNSDDERKKMQAQLDEDGE